MNDANSLEVSGVLEQVLSWTPDMKILLARKVLESLDAPVISAPPKKTMSLEDVIGALRTENAPPSDRECDEIVEQERQRKHG